jgi:hypothetical protein
MLAFSCRDALTQILKPVQFACAHGRGGRGAAGARSAAEADAQVRTRSEKLSDAFAEYPDCHMEMV